MLGYSSGSLDLMVAEKAADLILGNTALNPEHVPFYKKEIKA